MVKKKFHRIRVGINSEELVRMQPVSPSPHKFLTFFAYAETRGEKESLTSGERL
jgi:hypothetical protein